MVNKISYENKCSLPDCRLVPYFFTGHWGQRRPSVGAKPRWSNWTPMETRFSSSSPSIVWANPWDPFLNFVEPTSYIFQWSSNFHQLGLKSIFANLILNYLGLINCQQAHCVSVRSIIDTLLSDASVSSCVKHMHRQRLANEKSMPPLSCPPPAPTLSMRNPISPPSDFFASFAFFAASSAFRFSSSSFLVGTYAVIKYWQRCFELQINHFEYKWTWYTFDDLFNTYRICCHFSSSPWYVVQIVNWEDHKEKIHRWNGDIVYEAIRETSEF